MPLLSVEVSEVFLKKLNELRSLNGCTDKQNLAHGVDLVLNSHKEAAALEAEKSRDDTPMASLLAEFNRLTEGGKGEGVERALYLLLDRWRHRLPDLDDYFHKAFRQCDVLDSAVDDLVVWNLLYDSRLFWKLFEKYKNLGKGA